MIVQQDGTELTHNRSDQRGSSGRAAAQSGAQSYELDMQNAQDVLQKSLQGPVIVVAYTHEKGLIETVEAWLSGFRDRVILATLDISAHPMLAQQLGFGASSSAKLIMQGQVLAELSGQEPEDQIRSLFERMVGPAGESDMEASPNASAEEQSIVQIEQARLKKEYVMAHGLLEQARQQFPDNLQIQALLGHVYLDQQDMKGAESVLAELAADHPYREQLVARIQFFEYKTAIVEWPEVLVESIESLHHLSDDDLWAQALLACEQTRYALCFDGLLALYQRNPGYQEQSPRRALQVLLTLMGPDHPEVKPLRRRLFSVLH